MGYNRSGVRRTARLKRAKRHEARLAKQAASQTKVESPGVLGTDKQAASTVTHTVGEALHAAAETITSKKE
jgi:hypothetical protein